MDVETEIAPPEATEDEDGDSRCVRVQTSLLDVGDTHYDAGVQLFGDDCDDPDRIAEALLRVTLALGGLYGPDVSWALQQRVVDAGK